MKGLIFHFVCALIFPKAVILQKIALGQYLRWVVDAKSVESWLHGGSFPNTNKPRLPSSFLLFFWTVSGLWLRLSGCLLLVLCLTRVGLCSHVTENSFRRTRPPCQPMCMMEATSADFLGMKPSLFEVQESICYCTTWKLLKWLISVNCH